MLLASWFLVYFLKNFTSYKAKNLGSVGWRAVKLPAIKLENDSTASRTRTEADWFVWGRGRLADFFLRPPTLTAGNFAALWPTDPKFWALKDLILLKKYIKNQETSSILKVDFALSMWPHFHRVYLVTIWSHLTISVYFYPLNHCAMGLNNPTYSPRLYSILRIINSFLYTFVTASSSLQIRCRQSRLEKMLVNLRFGSLFSTLV